MNVLLVQIDIDKSQYPEIKNLTTATESIFNEYSTRCKDRSTAFARAAAERFNWNYELITERRTKFEAPTFEIFDLFTDDYYTEMYDRIIYLDTDVYYFPDSPSILDYYPNEGFHAVSRVGRVFQEGKEPDHLANIDKSYLIDSYRKNGYFNSGVILIDRKTIYKMRSYFKPSYVNELLQKKGLWSDDQSMINIAAHDSGVNLVAMHDYWNQMDKRYSEGYLVHLKGSIKNRPDNVFDKRAETYAISSGN